MQKPQTRVVPGPLNLVTRDGAPLPTITGYAAVFWRAEDPGTMFQLWPGRFERIMPGAFNNVLMSDVRGLFNHKPDAVLGRVASGTLRLSVDARGLRYDLDPPDTAAGRDVVELIRRGDVTGSSFAFIPKRTMRVAPTPDDPNEYLDIYDVDLYDVGPVTFPAYGSTEAAVRSAEGSLAILEAHRKAAADRDKIAVTLTLMGMEDV